MKFGQWELTHDVHNWILTRHYVGKNRKTGEETPGKETTYHRDLPQVSNWILNRAAKDASDHSEDLKALTTALRSSEAHLTAELKAIQDRESLDIRKVAKAQMEGGEK